MEIIKCWKEKGELINERIHLSNNNDPKNLI